MKVWWIESAPSIKLSWRYNGHSLQSTHHVTIAAADSKGNGKQNTILSKAESSKLGGWIDIHKCKTEILSEICQKSMKKKK